MTLTMPEPDRAVMARRAEIVAMLRAIVPGEGVIDHPDALRPHESDALTAYRHRRWLSCCRRRWIRFPVYWPVAMPRA